MMQTVWVWYCKSPHGGYLFHGNRNSGMPPFHLGCLDNLIYGERLVWERTRKVLEMNVDVRWWNQQVPYYRVEPKLVTIEISPADSTTRSRHKQEEGCSFEKCN